MVNRYVVGAALEGVGIGTVITAVGVLVSPWVAAIIGGMLVTIAGYSLGKPNAGT